MEFRHCSNFVLGKVEVILNSLYIWISKSVWNSVKSYWISETCIDSNLACLNSSHWREAFVIETNYLVENAMNTVIYFVITSRYQQGNRLSLEKKICPCHWMSSFDNNISKSLSVFVRYHLIKHFLLLVCSHSQRLGNSSSVWGKKRFCYGDVWDNKKT